MWKRLLGGGLLLRRAVRELGGIREQLTRQNDTLERLLHIYAPEVVLPKASATLGEITDTGVSFLDQTEAGLVMEYVAKTQADTGRAPTDGEILSYLADERTISLHQRLKQREASADLDRLQDGPT